MFDLEEVISKLPDRFVSKFVVSDQYIDGKPELGPCWLWTGWTNPKGYGSYWDGTYNPSGSPHKVRSHKFTYIAVFGPVGQGMVLDHICFNRHCVSPWHVKPTTNHRNAARRKNANRSGYTGVFSYKPNGPFHWQYNGKDGLVRPPGSKGYADAKSCYVDRVKWIRKNLDPDYLDEGYEWVLEYL